MNCNLCHEAEAGVFCLADEAALCLKCNEDVHNVNKLASKHPRVPLIRVSSHLPRCDICQEEVGYLFFCVEDRCLVCRKCDVAIHMVNSLVATHNRFLLPGVKVGDDASSSSSVNIGCSNKTSRPEALPIAIASDNTVPPPNPLTSDHLPVQDSFTPLNQYSEDLNFQDSLGGEILPFVGNVDELIDWATKDCNFIDKGSSSKADGDASSSLHHGDVV